MSETDWLACGHPGWLLTFLSGKTSERKLRLYASACCRRIWHLLTDSRSRNAVRVAERFADGKATAEKLVEAYHKAGFALIKLFEAAYMEINLGVHTWESKGGPRDRKAIAHAIEATVAAKAGSLIAAVNPEALSDIPDLAFRALYGAAKLANPESGSYRSQTFRTAIESQQADYVRDIFGNPFRPVKSEQSWRSGTVVSLSEFIYKDRAFDQMFNLAAALEADGCDNMEVLRHCRQASEHVRGCWVLDLILT